MCAQLARLAFSALALLAPAVPCLRAAPRTLLWTLERSAHFELYSQLDERHTRQLLDWFEQTRAVFLKQSIVPAAGIPPVRIIAFASAKDYELYRIRAFSDGSYAQAGDRHYITMFAGDDQRRVAAHELAHALFSSSAITPLWFSEGLAEYFSTLRVAGSNAEIGGDFAERRLTLLRRSWIPVAELLAITSEDSLRADRERGEMFYAESWLLADMLVSSPRYGSKFQALRGALRSGKSAADAFRAVCGEAIEEIDRDLHEWLRGRAGARPIRIAASEPPMGAFETSQLSDSAIRPLLADMLAAAGQLDRAGAILSDLAREQPRDSRILAAVGSLALQKGNAEVAREAWKQAVAQGLADADIAYRYALLADQAGSPRDEIRDALERAVALKPDFDDARYKLALLEKNAGNYDAAIAQLRAMHNVAPARAYAYWTVMADACNELGRRGEALDAARRAAQHAHTAGERALAENLAYVSQTDFAVQFARAADGRAEMITTRVPHQSAEDWNPFVEAGDDVRTAS
ncbi:MAG TPA: hypothetical protein VKG79_01570, partial [Bryobacteraceae bacterium]|nr:hypothetical protein [Bryobacteraceae bacterium]